MEKIPEEMKIVHLEVLLMPNGEIICSGRSIGWFDKYKKYLHEECKRR